MKKDGKYFNQNPTPLPNRRHQLTLASDGVFEPKKHHFDEDGSDEDGDTLGLSLKETLSFERVIDRCYVKDFRRLGLISNLSNVSKR